MKKIKIFFTLLIVNCAFLIGTASAQWWVQGGNLLWPYGNVTVEKNFSVNDTLFVTPNTKLYTEDIYSMMFGHPYVGTDLTLQSHTTSGERILTLGNSGLSLEFDPGTGKEPYFNIDNGTIGLNTELGSITFSPMQIQMYDNNTNAEMYIQFGAGSPEGTFYGSKGSNYLRTDGPADSTLYIKTSEYSATGWIVK